MSASLVALTAALSTTLAAQSDSANASVRVRGSGAETWVLLTGLVGGTVGMRQMEQALVRRNYRVVTIDAYALSIDSLDVSFAALARRVDAQLNELQVHHARVVGHSHGGGVALR
ncbi:MAG: alpha/beta hydrolase, partial [Gemmatimonadota bacterium]|nr:alpha/beta hydrolase [Gemmatimonadota bacterium]